MLYRYGTNLVRCLALGGFALLLTSSASFAVSITNGSFEAVQVVTGGGSGDFNLADVPGWAHTGSEGDGVLWHAGPVCCGGVGASRSGDEGGTGQFVTMGGGFGPFGSASWSQTIGGLTVGNNYIITFMMSSEFAGTQNLTVGMTSGSSSAAQTFTSPISPFAFWQDWGTDQYTFLAADTSATLQFSVTNQQFDVGLDAVSIADAGPAVAGVPEPGSLAIISTALLGLVAIRRRRKTV